MAEKKYLDEIGLQDVASHVNTRLKTVTSIPVSADNGAVRLYVGTTTATYIQGHIYQYNSTDSEWVDITSSGQYIAGNGINIDANNEISTETVIFTGTQEEWDALTTAEKQIYNICNITDDMSDFDGGTTVIPNPTGTATDELEKIQIGSTIYKIENSVIGSQITPTNDVQTLLHCANIYDKTSYTTISDVLADTVILKILIDNNNSADYLVRSTTWASAVTANSIAMTYIGANNYCTNKMLDDSTWCTAICNSIYFESVLNVKVPTMTGYTTPSGEVFYSSGTNESNPYYSWNLFDNNDSTLAIINGYNETSHGATEIISPDDRYFAYDFGVKVRVNKIYMKWNGTAPSGNGQNYWQRIDKIIIRGSNDKVNWTNIQELDVTSGEFTSLLNNNTGYRYYSLTISQGARQYINMIWYAIASFQFYGRTNVDDSITLVPWSTGTERQITKMINAYYEGTLSLDEIKSVWSIGDVRNINISSIATSGGSGATAWSVGESHRAQTVQLQILDFDHDTLETAINGKTKALITVDTKGFLRDASVADTAGSTNTENGYMNSTQTNVGGWKSCARRSWCNNAFYNSLPSYVKSLIKTVIKTTGQGNNSSATETTDDKAFLLSENEFYGTSTNVASGEGTLYKLYETSANRRKYPIWSNNDTLAGYGWLRSATLNTTNYAQIASLTSYDSNRANYTYGIAPAMCL